MLPSGELTGFDIDIAKALCAQMGADCEIVNQSFDGLIPALNAKKIDAIIASMSITADRAEGDRLRRALLHACRRCSSRPKDSGIEITADGLERQVRRRAARHRRWRTTSKNFPGARVQLYDTSDAANLDLASGRVDLVFADSVVLQDFLATPGRRRTSPRSASRSTTPRSSAPAPASASRKGDAELKQKFNDALAAIIASGEYKTINEKYIPVSILPK